MWNTVMASSLVFALSALFTPPVGALAWWIGAVDVPRDGRRMHREPTPRCGGIAILLAVFIGLAAFGAVDRFLTRVIVGACLLAFVGLLDDILSISPFFKLTVQVLSAVAVCGFSFRAATLAAILWITLLANAHNFIDGIDGLFAGCAVVEGIALAIALQWIGATGAALAALLIGASCLAFRGYNRHPARIFAGDCGSATVGYLFGALSLPLFFEMQWRAGWLAPLFLFAYPLTDLGVSVIRRILRGRNPFCADRGHLHHRICSSGVGQIACGNILILLCTALSALGVCLCTGEFLLAASLACLLAAVLLIEVRLLFLTLEETK